MKFERLTSKQDVDNLIQYHNRWSKYVVIDTETTSVNPREAKLIDVQLSGRLDDTAYIFDAAFASGLLNFSSNILFVAHNYKYDAHVLFNAGVDLLDRCWHDTLLIGHLLDENRESYSLKSYVKELYDDDYKDFWEKYDSYESAPEEDRVLYACKDIVYTNRLYQSFLDNPDFASIPELVRHVHRLQRALLRTEITGICIDRRYLSDLGLSIRNRLDALEPQMRSLVKNEIEIIELEDWAEQIQKYKTPKGREGVTRPVFNFGSSKQLQRLLYGQLQIPAQQNEKTKAVSVDTHALERVRNHHPIVDLIQQNRELAKIYGTYIQGTLERQIEGRVYPEFRVAGTVTGRLAHSNPNLAQLPKSGGVRGIYVPTPESYLLSADYSQLEVVIEANLTSDPNLRKMLENGESKHDLTARELGVDRALAKTLNFALQYWASHFKVAQLLGVSPEEGLKVWNQYWRIYSGCKRLKAATDEMVNRGEPIETRFGRKRHFVKKSRHPWDADYRQAYNFLIQGTGADITSRAFYLVDDYLRECNIGRGLFSVHDELIIEVRKDSVEQAETKLLNTMAGIGNDIGFEIPLKAESSGAMERWED